ncbi:hypothetical protein BDN70DRAFT_794795 [Pholiota conissans]|uniref:Uncharacterized protein n=1 Tax=Pholiota conissans TaxID=109636 RepID=A0A9P5ZGQ2_9AGAR|nr:hypothetical protein BDN70DRAFT_794795 [Pholiota conissans]
MPSPTSSGTATANSPVFGPIAINAQVEKTRSFSRHIKAPLNGLTAAFDSLSVQTLQIALSQDVGTTQGMIELRDQMLKQDQKHKEGLAEIQNILDDLLQHQIMEAMRKQVEEEIVNQIDEIVKEKVAECLKEHIPPELQEEFATSKKELQELTLRLHNSESRRANGKLRSNKADDPLGTMFMTNGTVSTNYPKDLRGLFTLDAEKARALMEDYELPDISDSRDRNLNKLMQFCGMRYQLVE